MGAADFLKISSKKRLTRGGLGGNLFRHPKRRDRREGSASGLRDGTEAGSGNLENDTEKRSEQRQLILRERIGRTVLSGLKRGKRAYG
ncbi:hypothetical protein SDC9_113003 [bioreactor metagenome]|uniref:Uncharacterized protein n=1 Tax=bioreactor metagenome TaxID=1076179 RepID=A0A645BLD1_9ZZZZ